MPFGPGMDDFLHSFAPVPLARRLQLKPGPIQLRKTREKVASWYRAATALESRKPMPTASDGAEIVITRVDYANGNSYRGEWVNGKRHGKGQYLCQSKGYLYRGEWADDTIHGQGSMFERQPDKTWFLVYVGDHKKGLRDGWGTMRKAGDEYYEGHWKLGKREGWGRHFAGDGTVYEGQWHDDKRSGYGCTREGTGNHHVGEYLDDRKHGPGKYNFIQTGKRLDGTWSNDIPVLGEISQLCRHKPSFPHQYPLPPQGLRDPRAVLADGLLDAYCAVPPEPLRPLACPADPEPRAMPQPPLSLAHSRLLGSSGAGADNGEMDMRQLLVELEPEVAAITDSHVAAKTGNYLLAMEYWWRCTADRAGPRPLRMQRLMAKDSQELLSLADD